MATKLVDRVKAAGAGATSLPIPEAGVSVVYRVVEASPA